MDVNKDEGILTPNIGDEVRQQNQGLYESEQNKEMQP